MMFRKTSTMLEILQNITPPPPPPRIYVLISLCCLLASLSLLSLQAQNAPSPPTGVSASGITNDSVTLNWTKSSGATSYEVRYNANPVIFNDWLDVGDVASYTFTGLTANRPYTFSLRAKNANGVSSNVNTIANTLDGPNKAPPDPTGLSASNITHSSVTLNWTKSSGATSYEVLVIEFEGEDTDFFDVGDVASYTFTGLTADRTHAFTLRAKNSYGISVAVSLSRSITTLVAPPGWGRSSRSPTATPMFTPSPKPTVHTLKQLPAEIQVNNWLDGAQGRRVGIAEIAQPDIIAQGVLDAVDVFGYVSPGVEVCFSAHGRIVFLDAAYAPRRAFDLSAYQRAGRTCALIDRAGTVVLLRGDSPPPPQNTPPANTNPDGGRGLGECEVRPWANLKVRQEPPDGLVLGVTASRDWLRASDKQAGYFRVGIWQVEGWISGAYVATRGDCGA